MKEHRWYVPSLPLTVVNVTKTISFVLGLAALANILIIKVAFEVHFLQVMLTVTSVVVAIGMFVFVYRSHKVTIPNIYISLVSVGLWSTQTAEIIMASVRGYSKIRQIGFYVAFALLSAFLYSIQRIVRESRLENFIDEGGEVHIDGA